MTRARTAAFLRLALGIALSWTLLYGTMPTWSPWIRPLAEGAVRSFEPWELTQRADVVEDGRTLRFTHAYQAKAPRASNVRLPSLTYGLALWIGLVVAVPGLTWRRRATDLTLGLFVTALLAAVALVARVHHQYATLDIDPFPQLFDNWRGWTAYFVNMFFLEIGFFVLPVALTALLHRERWREIWTGEEKA